MSSAATSALSPSSLLVQATAAFVREEFQANDASHDWAHIERVWTLARAIAREEVRMSKVFVDSSRMRSLQVTRILMMKLLPRFAQNVPDANLEIVDLAALLHDIDDYKYQTENAPTKRAQHFLESQDVSAETIARVMVIIDNMGFKEELGGQTVGGFKLVCPLPWSCSSLLTTIYFVAPCSLSAK